MAKRCIGCSGPPAHISACRRVEISWRELRTGAPFWSRHTHPLDTLLTLCRSLYVWLCGCVFVLQNHLHHRHVSSDAARPRSHLSKSSQCCVRRGNRRKSCRCCCGCRWRRWAVFSCAGGRRVCACTTQRVSVRWLRRGPVDGCSRRGRHQRRRHSRGARRRCPC